MAFDKDFNIMGESKLAGKRYSCFTGWCALKILYCYSMKTAYRIPLVMKP